MRWLVASVEAAIREAVRPIPIVTGFKQDLLRSRDELLAENAMLRQQLIVAGRMVKQPKFRSLERTLMVAISSVVKNWQNAVLLGKPDIVLRWHREGFRLPWRRKPKTSKKRQPRISPETIELIRDMAVRNETWGSAEDCRPSSVDELDVRAVHRARPHQGLQQRIPVPCTTDDSASGGQVVALPVLDGLHHDYMRVA